MPSPSREAEQHSETAFRPLPLEVVQVLTAVLPREGEIKLHDRCTGGVLKTVLAQHLKTARLSPARPL